MSPRLMNLASSVDGIKHSEESSKANNPLLISEVVAPQYKTIPSIDEFVDSQSQADKAAAVINGGEK
eukprot:gene31850-41330_t